MKKLLFFLALTISLISCGENYHRTQISELKQEHKTLSTQVSNLRNSCNNLRQSQHYLSAQVRELETEKQALSKGYEPNYILTLEIKQATYTLNVGEHIKNSINAISLQIPVSKKFYNSVSVGTRISNDFKYGSLVFNGDFSELRVTVKDKQIR